MKKMLIRFFLTPYLVASLVSCGGGGGSSSLADTQNAVVKELSSGVADIVAAVEDFNKNYGDLDVYDEEAGNAWLDLFNNTIVPGLDAAYENIQALEAGENEITTLINQANASAMTSKAWFVPILLAGVFLASVGASLLNTGLKVKARVKAVEDKIDQGRASGSSQAEAMGQASSTFKQAFNETRLDIYNFIMTSQLSDVYKSVSGACGQILIDLSTSAGDMIDVGKTYLVGVKRKNETSKVTSADLSEAIYIGETANGTAHNFLPGTWDLIAYKDGYVRNVAEGVSVASCSTTGSAAITLVTMAELEEAAGEKEGEDDGGGDKTGSFEIISYINTDGSTGSSASGAQISVSGNTSYPTIGWTISNVIAITVTTGSGTGVYGIVRIEDEFGDVTPFSSPVTYGNYSISNTATITSYANPSPALSSGTTYGITLNTKTGTYASVAFRIK